MDFVDYVKTLKRYWWLVVGSALVFALLAAALTMTGDTTYSSNVKSVVGPASTINLNSDLADSLSALDRRTVLGTYAEIAASDRLRAQAAEAAGLKHPGDYHTSAVVLAQANAVQINVEGTNKKNVRALTASLADESESFFEEFYRLYEVEQLNPASTPVDTGQSAAALAAVGFVVGAAIGFLLALAAQRMRQDAASSNVLP